MLSHGKDNAVTHYKCRKCGWEGTVNGRPRCMECCRVRVSRWRKENPEKLRAQKRRYDKRMRMERREEYNARRRRKRSAKRNAEARQRRITWFLAGDVTREQLIFIFEKGQGKCHYCGQAIIAPRFTPTDPRGFDHMISRAKGGKHTATNITPCCRLCNELKGDKDV